MFWLSIPIQLCPNLKSTKSFEYFSEFKVQPPPLPPTQSHDAMFRAVLLTGWSFHRFCLWDDKKNWSNILIRDKRSFLQRGRFFFLSGRMFWLFGPDYLGKSWRHWCRDEINRQTVLLLTILALGGGLEGRPSGQMLQMIKCIQYRCTQKKSQIQNFRQDSNTKLMTM